MHLHRATARRGTSACRAKVCPVDEPNEIDLSTSRAGFFRRLGAFLIDSLVLSVANSIFISIILDTGSPSTEEVGLAFDLRSSLLSTAVNVLYYGLLEGRPAGQTLGKRALQIRVVDLETGEPIDYRRGFARALGKILSGLVFGLGFLWMLWDRDGQTWHDKFASTTVVWIQPPVPDQGSR